VGKIGCDDNCVESESMPHAGHGPPPLSTLGNNILRKVSSIDRIPSVLRNIVHDVSENVLLWRLILIPILEYTSNLEP